MLERERKTRARAYFVLARVRTPSSLVREREKEGGREGERERLRKRDRMRAM